MVEYLFLQVKTSAVCQGNSWTALARTVVRIVTVSNNHQGICEDVSFLAFLSFLFHLHFFFQSISQNSKLKAALIWKQPSSASKMWKRNGAFTSLI